MYTELNPHHKKLLIGIHDNILNSFADANFNVEQTFDTYIPHLTLAYIKNTPVIVNFDKLRGRVTTLSYCIDSKWFNVKIKQKQERISKCHTEKKCVNIK